MADASYERQHLALQAAGSINAAGTTAVTFGCGLTRIAAGHYALVLGENDGVVNGESFTLVTVKSALWRTRVVNDTSNTVKAIKVYDPAGAAPADADIEVALLKSVTR